MSAVSPTAGAATFDPAQLAAIQQAVSGLNPDGQTGNAINADITGDLSSDGLFSSSELAGLSGDGITGVSPWGNGAAPTSEWEQQVQQGLQSGASAGTAGDVVNSVLNPQQLAAGQPLPYSSFGSIPYVNPSTYSATTYSPTAISTQGDYVNPNQSQQYMNQSMNTLQTEMNPTFQTQDQNLDQSLAARGILNSGAAVQAQTDLGGQQAAALATAQEPIISQGYGYSQADLTGNAGVNQATNTGNAAAANTAAATNAGAINSASQYDATANNNTGEYNANNYLGITTGDQTAYNNYENELEQQGYNYGTGLLGSYLGTYGEPNSSVLGTMANGASSATQYGNNAYDATLNGSAGMGNAFGSAFSGLGGLFTGGSNAFQSDPGQADMGNSSSSTGTGNTW